jgi:benzoyl-CoA reductase/2-hydroxyglutaryl-CoA dehydratase subunit BcrC/BadD/HgdB
VDGRHLDGVRALQLYGGASGATRDGFNGRLREWLRTDALRTTTESAPAPRVLYSGTATDTVDFYAAMELAGLRIIDDDQDFGARAVGPIVDEHTPPLPALATALIGRAPSPAGWRHDARSAWLRQRIEDGRPEGVVFYNAAYDHPPAWEYPAQRALAESMGCACTLLDANSYMHIDTVTPAAQLFAAALHAH